MRASDAPQQLWIESVARAGVARWTGWLGKEQSVTGGGAKACIAETRWHWPVEAEKFAEINERGGALRLRD